MKLNNRIVSVVVERLTKEGFLTELGGDEAMEVIKELSYEISNETCEGCGKELIDGEAVIQGDNRHASCN